MEKLGRLDLNLLRVFDAVMTELNVTRAARRLYLSQPAVSHALSRLRHALKDDLFVRVPGGMRPTQKAMELSGPIGLALNALQDALEPVAFDPATSTRVFRVAAHDYFVTAMMAGVAGALETRAPHTSLRVRPTEGRAFELLDAQEADFAISAFGDLPERFEERTLFRDRYVCLVNARHPLARGRLTLKRFAAARHLLISPRGDERGFIDAALEQRGLNRQIALVINQFSPVGAIVAASDLLVTLPERIAKPLAGPYGLKVLACPLEAPEAFTRTSIIWHQRMGTHDAMTWFADLLADLAAEAEAGHGA